MFSFRISSSWEKEKSARNQRRKVLTFLPYMFKCTIWIYFIDSCLMWFQCNVWNQFLKFYCLVDVWVAQSYWLQKVKSRTNMVSALIFLLYFSNEVVPLFIRACLLDNPSSNFAKSLMLVACLVCITCSSAVDVSDFRLTGDSLCGHPACSLRQWGCSGEGVPAPVNYQLINSGSFLLVLVSACKRLLVCGIGGRHCDYGIRKKKYRHIFFPRV